MHVINTESQLWSEAPFCYSVRTRTPWPPLGYYRDCGGRIEMTRSSDSRNNGRSRSRGRSRSGSFTSSRSSSQGIDIRKISVGGRSSSRSTPSHRHPHPAPPPPKIVPLRRGDSTNASAVAANVRQYPPPPPPRRRARSRSLARSRYSEGLVPSPPSPPEKEDGNDDDSSAPRRNGRASRSTNIEIVAPSGELGLVLDSPFSDSPDVVQIKSSCPIRDEVRLGDRVVAVDDEDVLRWNAVRVSSKCFRIHMCRVRVSTWVTSQLKLTCHLSFRFPSFLKR